MHANVLYMHCHRSGWRYSPMYELYEAVSFMISCPSDAETVLGAKFAFTRLWVIVISELKQICFQLASQQWERILGVRALHC